MKHTTLITGASTGIGRATAEELPRGHSVIGLAEGCEGFSGGNIRIDRRRKRNEKVPSACSSCAIDGLVNNVGGSPAPLEEINSMT